MTTKKQDADKTEHREPGTRHVDPKNDPTPRAPAIAVKAPPEGGYSTNDPYGVRGKLEDADYYQVNALMQMSPEAPWQQHVEHFPTREEADARVENLKTSGAKSVRVTHGSWK